MLTDDYGLECKEIRVLPLGGEGNILCSYQGYLREIKYRIERNKELAESCRFDTPKWDDLAVYDKEE